MPHHTCRWAFVLFALTASGALADWPNFLGPNHNATAAQQDIAHTWPDGGPPMLWRADVGRGFGGAAIRDGKAFFMDNDFGETEGVRVLDLKTGEPLWHYRYEVSGRYGYGGTRATPAVTDRYVVTVGGFGHVHVIDRKTHKPAWSINMLEKYPDRGQRWGYGQNPLVYKDTLILSATSKSSPGLIAFDLATGKQKWKTSNFGDDKQYCSPTLAKLDGKTVVLHHNLFVLRLTDPDNGRVLYSGKVFSGTGVMTSVTSPIVMPDGEHLFATNGYEFGSVMYKAKYTGGKFELEEVFRMKRGSQIHPPVVFGDHLYMNINENAYLRGSRKSEGGLACIDAKSGDILWRTGTEPNLNRGALLRVDDKLLALDGDTGVLYLVEPNPRKFEVVSEFVALEPKSTRENNAWAPMAIAGGLLIVRDQQEIKCFDLRAKVAQAD